MYTYPFEKLEVWQLAKQLVVSIYSITNGFPGEEKFGMVSQMRRAAVSICSNLAEGSGRNTLKDQAYFYGMAYSSIMELLNQCLISRDLNWISEGELLNIRTKIETISIKINALRKATQNKIL
jgi:four helix bundle protein